MSVVESYNLVWQAHDGAKIYVDPNHDFKLGCSVHEGVDHCSHRQDVIRHNLDADQMWGMSGVPDEILIPIMPSMGIYAHLSIQEIDDNPDMVSVYYVSERKGNAIIQSDFLGFFSRGEGRKMLRMMMLNYLEVKFIEIDKCKGPRHGITEERIWRANQGNLMQHFKDQYNVWHYNLCTACFDKKPAYSSDDDLIPEADQPKANWAGMNPPIADATMRRPKRAPLPPKDFRPKFEPSTEDKATDDLF